MDRWSMELLGFADIRQQLIKYARTYLGQQMLAALGPTTERVAIESRFRLVDEGLTLHRLNKNIPLEELPDFTDIFQRLTNGTSAADAGIFISGIELVSLARMLKVGYRVQKALGNIERKTAPLLIEMAAEIITLPELV